MKTCIRKNIFETNSSSVHALVLKKTPENKSAADFIWDLPKDVRMHIENSGLNFGEKLHKWDWCCNNDVSDELKDFCMKLDELWEIVVSLPLKHIFKFMSYLDTLKNKFYIDYHLNTSDKYLDAHDDTYEYSDSLCEFVTKYILDSFEDFTKYILTVESRIDGYETDCYGAEERFWKDIDENELTVYTTYE